jgi:hypothetical protein|tara:strand:+ start:789 stop:1421 length:633 start_codon:yes stop_codon:yes gene_type:complete
MTKVISFYSDVNEDKYYSKCAKRLEKMSGDFSIDLHLEEKESLGSYRNNCLSKPKFIRDKLEEFKQPIVWTDVDTVFRKYPDAFDMVPDDVDVAFSSSAPNLNGMKASPLYFNYTEKAFFFLDEWINRSEQVLLEMDVNFDHEVLFGVFASCGEVVKYGVFPPTYCVWPQDVNEHTVIEMGMSDVPDKIEVLKKMGIDGNLLAIQTVGIL